MVMVVEQETGKMMVTRVLLNKSKRYQNNKCVHQDLQILIQACKPLSSSKIKRTNMVNPIVKQRLNRKTNKLPWKTLSEIHQPREIRIKDNSIIIITRLVKELHKESHPQTTDMVVINKTKSQQCNHNNKPQEQRQKLLKQDRFRSRLLTVSHQLWTRFWIIREALRVVQRVMLEARVSFSVILSWQERKA